MSSLKNIFSVLFTFFIFSNFIVFGYLKGIFPVAPIYSLLAIFVISVFLGFSKENFDYYISNKFTGWLLFYIVVSIVFSIYAFFSEVDLIYISQKNVDVLIVFLTASVVLFTVNQEEQINIVSKTIFILILIGVVFILFDLFNPLSFSDLVGRGAGMYLNANYAGAMLLMAMIFLKGRVSERWFFVLIITVGLGVIATFSRFALLFYCLYIVFIYWKKPKLLFSILLISVAVTLVALAYIESILPDFINVDELIYDRFSIFSFNENENASLDFSANQRKELLGLAVEDFLRSPIFGGGLGRHLSKAPSEHEMQLAHNTYIGLLVDYGYIGILIVPTLLYSIYLNSPINIDSRFIIFVVFVILNGFFSHNLLDHYGFIFFYALFASELFHRASKEQNYLEKTLLH
jgi:O-antigen ligase